MTTPIIIETSLGQALAEISQKLDNVQKDVKQGISRILTKN